MAFKKVCAVEDIWEGEMDSFEVEGKEVLLICKDGGEFKAYQGICPHQDIPLVEGKFDGKIITCRAHLWQFDSCDGKGVNPKDCALAEFPVKVENDDVFVDVAGIEPLFAHT